MMGPRVLILEDEPLIAMLVQDWLTELECEPIGPSSKVHEALALVRNQELDAAILDVSLGNEACYPVADLLHARKVPFAFATGHGDESIPARLKGAPMLRKPYDLQAVKVVLEQLLAKSENT